MNMVNRLGQEIEKKQIKVLKEKNPYKKMTKEIPSLLIRFFRKVCNLSDYNLSGYNYNLGTIISMNYLIDNFSKGATSLLTVTSASVYIHRKKSPRVSFLKQWGLSYGIVLTSHCQNTAKKYLQ